MQFHLRKPSWTIDETRGYLDKINPKFYSRIFPHDHYELFREYGLKGIHINERNSDYNDELKKQSIPKSVSAHSILEADVYAINKFDDVLLSPIFDSISKSGYSSAFNEEELKLFLEKSRESEVIALSGVSSENLMQCKELGFDGVAVLGAIWNSPQPLESFKQLNEICQTSAIIS